MKPTSNRILVEPIVETKSRGGIHYPASALSEFGSEAKLYRVLDVGPGRLTKKGVRIPMDVKPGDRVLCQSYTEGPIPVQDGKKIITENQVLMIL